MPLTQVSTDGVKNDAITKVKIPANQIEASELADNAVDTNAIANNAVTAGKLASGVQTTINNNADNRLITGSGTANTLNGESNLTFDGSRLGINNPNFSNYSADCDDFIIQGSGNTGITINSGGTGNSFTGNLSFAEGNGSGGSADAKRGLISYKHNDDYMSFHTNVTERMRIDSSGNVGIGNNNPDQKLKIQDSNDVAIHILKTGSQDTLIKNTGQTEICAASGGASGQRIAFKIGANTGSLSDIAKFTDSGLCFGSDTAAANALHDYEEGTAFTSTGNATVYHATYVKVGNIVNIVFRLNVTSGGQTLSLPFGAYSGDIHLGTTTNFYLNASTLTFPAGFHKGTGTYHTAP